MWFNKVPWNVIQEHCIYSPTAGFHWPSLSILPQGLIHLSTYHHSLSSVSVSFSPDMATYRQTSSSRGTTNLSVCTNRGAWRRSDCLWKKSRSLVKQGCFFLHWDSSNPTGRSFGFTRLLAAVQHSASQEVWIKQQHVKHHKTMVTEKQWN